MLALALDGLLALEDLLALDGLLALEGLLVAADLVVPDDLLEPEDPFEPDARLERVGLLVAESTLRLALPAPVVAAAARVCPLLEREAPEVVPDALRALVAGLRALVAGLRELLPPVLALLLLLDVLRLELFVGATRSPFQEYLTATRRSGTGNRCKVAAARGCRRSDEFAVGTTWDICRAAGDAVQMRADGNDGEHLLRATAHD